MNEFGKLVFTPRVDTITIMQASPCFKHVISTKKTKNPIYNISRWRFHELDVGFSIFMRMADVSPAQHIVLIAAIRKVNQKEGITLKLYKNKTGGVYEVCRIE